MAKIVYSAYSSKNISNTDYEPIYNSPPPHTLDRKTDTYKILYLQNGLTIANGGFVTLISTKDAASAYLPDADSATRISDDFLNAANTTIEDGGRLILDGGAVASGSIIKGSEEINFGWKRFLDSKGKLNQEGEPPVQALSIDAVIHSGGTQFVRGGMTDGTAIYNGGLMTVEGNTLVKDALSDNPYNISKNGSAFNTTIYESGTMIVSGYGNAYGTDIRKGTLNVNSNGSSFSAVVRAGGTMNVNQQAYAADTTVLYGAELNVSKNATLGGTLFTNSTENITITSGAVFAEGFTVCMDLSLDADANLRFSDPETNISLLNNDFYKSLSPDTNFSLKCAASTKDGVYRLIDTADAAFDKSISITNGNLLELGREVYDDLGNVYVLQYDAKTSVYSVVFDNCIQYREFLVEAGETRIKSNPLDEENRFFLNSAPYSALYGVNFEITSPNINDPLTEEQKNKILKSISGTLTIKKNNKNIGTCNIVEGKISSSLILLDSFDAKETEYLFDLKTDTAFDVPYNIIAAVSSIILNNTNANDDKWQQLAEDYILAGKSVSVKNEYIGYGDTIDFRRIDFADTGIMNIDTVVKALTGNTETITISVYKTILDGSYSQLMLTVSQPVDEGLFSLKNISVEKGSYYIEVKANNVVPSKNLTGAINYELNINNIIFDQPSASKKDDSASKSKHYFAGETLKANSENSVFTNWVGPGDNTDYRLINIETSGKYSFSISKIIAENAADNSILAASIVKVGNGYEQIIANTYLWQNQQEAFFKDLLISYEPDYEYYLKISNITPNIQADYSVKIENNELFTAANPNDNSFDTAVEYTGTVGGGEKIVNENYLGYGDTVDYVKFNISEAGKYSITLENDLVYGASAILYKEVTGSSPVYLSATGVTYLPKANGIFQAISPEIELFAGTYYLQISGGNNYNADGNTTYSVKITGGEYAALTASNGEFKANTVYSFKAENNSNVILDSSLYGLFYVYTEGPYGQQYVPFNEYTVFEAGKTYYFMSYYTQNSTSGVTVRPAASDPLKSNDSITETVTTSDTVDYQLLDINGVGKYTLALNKSESDKIFYIELLEYTNGYMLTLNAAYSADNVIEFSTNLIPNENSSYYARVTCINPKNNYITNYTLSLNAELNEKANRNDDTAENAAPAIIGNDGYIVKNEYLGFGDTVDYIKFDISKSGKYTITLENDLAYGASAVLYRLNENSTSSAVNPVYITATGVTYLKTNDIYSASSWETELLKGTYYLQVSGGSNYTDTLDTSYSIKINTAEQYQSLTSVENSLYANTVYTLNVNEKSNIILSDPSLYYQFMVYTDNGANGHTWVYFNEFTVFSPDKTYYFVAYSPVNVSTISINPLESIKPGESVTDKVDKTNSVDYHSLNITECGEYTLSLEKIIDSSSVNKCVLLLELLQETNGIIQTLGATYILDNNISGEIKNICIDPTGGSSYYFRVTNLNSYAGYFANYTVNLNGKSFAADPANNSFDSAETVTVNNKNNIVIAENDYLGFGDTVDYFTFEITEDGQYALSLSSELQYGASAVLYYYNETYNYMQYVTATSVTYCEDTTAENEKFYFRTDMTSLAAGKYYAVISGGSAYSSALNTTYSLDIVGIDARALTSTPEKFDLNEYAALTFSGEGDIYYAEISGSQYTLFYEGIYGLTPLYPYNGRILLDPSQKYYVRSDAADNYLNFTAEAITNKAENTYESSTGGHFESNSNWIGLNDASDSWEFDTFGSEAADGASRWEVITVNNIRDTVGTSTLFYVTLYKEVNGSWTWAGSSYTYYDAYTDTETAGKLSVNLEADTRYKVEVSTSDNGAGNCAGYFDFSRDIYEYDLTNNTFQTATALEDTAKGTVTFAGDSIDIYEINAAGSFELQLDTAENSAAVNISFYDENYNAVYLPGSGYSIALNLYNSSFAFEFANGGEDIKFIKVEAAGGLVNSYNISQKA